MMGFGFLVAKFGLFVHEIVALQGGEPTETPAWSVWIGAVLVALGATVNLAAGVEHWRVRRELGGAAHRFRAGYRLGIGVALLLAVVGALMVVRLFVL